MRVISSIAKLVNNFKLTLASFLLEGTTIYCYCTFTRRNMLQINVNVYWEKIRESWFSCSQVERKSWFWKLKLRYIIIIIFLPKSPKLILFLKSEMLSIVKPSHSFKWKGIMFYNLINKTQHNSVNNTEFCDDYSMILCKELNLLRICKLKIQLNAKESI